MNDVILNGQAHGSVAETLLANGFDVNALRPYVGKGDRSYVSKVVNGELRAVPLANAVATLRKDEWKKLDDAIVRVAHQRLKLVGDLRGAGLQYTIPNGMGKTVLETETMGDMSDAEINMDGLTRTAGDRPVFELTNLPLPIAHKDFQFSLRQIQTSRNGSTPLDTTSAEVAARKVSEKIEKLALGLEDAYAYGGGTIYGLTNYPSANTKTMTAPTAEDWAGTTLVTEILAMRQQAMNAYHYGPYRLYVSPSWDSYLDNDFKSNSDRTLRERIAAINGIQSISTLDYLTGYKMLLVQMTPDVVRMVIGMDMTTVQWDTSGGLQKNFKVMAIMVPQLRADQNGNCGIVYGSTA